MDSPIFTSTQMRETEEAAFAHGVEVEALMDQAGAGIARAIAKFFPRPEKCIVFAGKGHNAGDALVAAECLRQRGWKIEVRLAFKESDCSELMRKKLDALRHAPAQVTVIDRRNHHLFQPLLYQVATAGLSPADIAVPIRSILGRQKNASVLMAGGWPVPGWTVRSSFGTALPSSSCARCGPTVVTNAWTLPD